MKSIRRSFAAHTSLNLNPLKVRIRQSILYILYEPGYYTPAKLSSRRYFYRKGKYFVLND